MNQLAMAFPWIPDTVDDAILDARLRCWWQGRGRVVIRDMKPL